MRLVDVENLDVVSWQSIPEGYSDTFEDGVRWILEKIDKLQTEPQSKLTNDQIWEELSEVYNMPNLPDGASHRIGNLMLALE